MSTLGEPYACYMGRTQRAGFQVVYSVVQRIALSHVPNGTHNQRTVEMRTDCIPQMCPDERCAAPDFGGKAVPRSRLHALTITSTSEMCDDLRGLQRGISDDVDRSPFHQ